MRLVSELRRRKVLRMAALYGVAAWLIVQVAGVLIDLAKLPDWIGTTTLWVLIIGFPIALIFSWFYEITPEGIGLEKDSDPDVALTHVGDRRLDFLVISLLCAAVILFAFDKWGSSDPPDRSVAVLPFVDMSPNGDQEYFGDGIAEELLNELVRLDGLRVAGRTSSFSFKGTNENLKSIAEALNVATILEGSIRKDGDQVRITAQLINIADGENLWAQTYNRELKDIFAIQEEIATEVSGALGVKLGVGGVNAFKGAGTRNIEAYEAYLQGMSMPIMQATATFERATRLDPNYAAAWAQMGQSIGVTHWLALPEDVPAIFERAHPFYVRAVELDPASAVANTLLGNSLYFFRKNWVGADKAFAKALLLLTDRPTLWHRANLLMRAGRSAMARQLYDRAESLEPLGGLPAGFREYVSLAQLNFTEAKEIAEWHRGDPLRMNFGIEIALNEGDPEEIKTAIRSLPKTNISTDALYYPVLRVFDSPEMVLSALRAIYVDEGTQWPSKLHDIALLAAYFDDPQFALQVKAEEVRNTPGRLAALWYPVMSEVRQLPEFKELVTDINLVAYWRASGWADLCRPLGDDDFECM